MKKFAHRDRVLKLEESRRIAMKVRKRLPPNSTSEVQGRPVRMRKLLAAAVVLERTHFGQMGEPDGIVGKAEADDGERPQRELFRNLFPGKIQLQPKAKKD